MSWYSCICVIRLEDSNMQNAIDNVNSYLEDNDYLCSLLYIAEEKELEDE